MNSNNETIRPNGFAILPAPVRYDKRLSFDERVLFGEITALCAGKYYCLVSDDYFAELYETDEATISRWIDHLTELGYIRVGKRLINGRVIGLNINIS